MHRSVIAAALLVGLVWGAYAALQSPKVAARFQPRWDGGAALAALLAFNAAGNTQGIDTILCPKRPGRVCAPIRPRGLTLLVGHPFVMGVASSEAAQATLYYNDTLPPARLMRDSVGVRLIGAEGAVSVQPSETRYARVTGRMGPWQWIVTPQRAGRFNLLLDFVRLPGDLERLLRKPDSLELRRQARIEVPGDLTLHRGNYLPVLVLTEAGWTAEEQAWMKIAGWILTFVIAAFPIREFIQRKKRKS